MFCKRGYNKTSPDPHPRSYPALRRAVDQKVVGWWPYFLPISFTSFLTLLLLLLKKFLQLKMTRKWDGRGSCNPRGRRMPHS